MFSTIKFPLDNGYSLNSVIAIKIALYTDKSLSQTVIRTIFFGIYDSTSYGNHHLYSRFHYKRLNHLQFTTRLNYLDQRMECICLWGRTNGETASTYLWKRLCRLCPACVYLGDVFIGISTMIARSSCVLTKANYFRSTSTYPSHLYGIKNV